MGHLVTGMLLLLLGLWGMVTWWETYGLVMRAVVPTALLVVGTLGVLSGYHRLGTTAYAEPGAGDAEEED